MSVPLLRSVPLTRRMIEREAGRFAITLAGTGMVVVLMLFLLALFEGVRTEANGWVASRPATAWVAKRNTTNFIKASSFVDASAADTLRASPDVVEVTPLLRLITLLDTDVARVTTIVIGIDPASDLGRPDVIAGSSRLDASGIVVDGALAKRLGLVVGDELGIEGRRFHVVGLSRGTNSILTQFAFIPMDDARELSGLPMVSYFLVKGAPGVSPDALVADLRARAPDLEVLSQDAFSENNMDELRGGLIPVLASVAVIGGLVAVIVLTLLLYGSVLERREDYALLKAIGAPTETLVRVVAGQALAAVAGGLVVGIVAYEALAPIVSTLAPAVPLALSPHAVGLVALGALVGGAVGALLPLSRITRIHPAEVFRA